LFRPGVDADRSQLEVLCALFHRFTLVAQLRVEALSYIDVREAPPVSEMLPNEDRHIMGASNEPVIGHLHVLGLQSKGVFVLFYLLVGSDPLDARDLLKVAELVA
jgi:hypothetical protein